MRQSRGWLAVGGTVAGAAVLIFAACGPVDVPASSPTPSASATASSVPLTESGQARQILNDLIAAAGSAHAIKVEFTASEATLTVVIGSQAQTWVRRNGQIRQTEKDVDYVGQTIFDPRDFALADLGDLFARAAGISGSSQGQQLHILEYSNGRVFMSVTTNPESVPVFFRQDGSLVGHLDFTTLTGLDEGLTDVVAGHPEVFSVGLDASSGGLYALSPGPSGVIQTLRMPQLPARDSAATSSTDNLTLFDPSLIDPPAIAAVISRLPQLTGQASPSLTWSIEQRDAATQPELYITASGHHIEATLAGTIVSS